MYYLYRSQIKQKNGVVMLYLDQSFPIFIFNLVYIQKTLRGLVGDEFFPTQKPKEETLIAYRFSVSLSIFMANVQMILILQFHPFTTLPLGPYRPHTQGRIILSLCILMVRRRFHTERLLCGTDKRKYASPITMILASSGFGSIIIRLTSPHNLHVFHPIAPL